MSGIDLKAERINERGQPFFIGDGRGGPITFSRKRRTLAVYLGCVLLGLLPLFLALAPGWQAAGLGLIFPGGGFIAVGGWALLLLPIVLVLFLVSLIAWFGSGMSTAPLLVWFGSAGLAGLLADGPIWGAAPYIVMALALLIFVRSKRKQSKALVDILRRRDERNQYLAQAMADVERRAVPAAAPGERELSEDELASLRYNLDLAFKGSDDFSAFETIEQFQTSALRYQLNAIGYSLSVAQCHYTPNFHGYLSQAQRNVIEKYLNKRVWGYWRWEKLWGHLSLNYDPAARDNIMLTGFYGLQICLYMGNTGDMRYELPGSLTFKWGNTEFRHDVHSLIRSIEENFQREEFCLYPCEPNWVYTPCNFIGMTALAAYDRVFGTDKFRSNYERFMSKLDSEFTNADGDVVALRSNITGFSVPFPFGNESRAFSVNPLDAQRAIQAWAMARHDLIEEVDGRVAINNLDKGVDFGRYKKAPVGMAYMLLQTANELGDSEVASEALRVLEEQCNPQREGGVLRYACSTTIGTGLVRARILRKDDWRNLVLKGPLDSTRHGPVLTDASYPQVLVAKAFSKGEDLELVLYPGQDKGLQVIKIERLQANSGYRLLSANAQSEFFADGQGCHELTVDLQGRTELMIQPL